MSSSSSEANTLTPLLHAKIVPKALTEQYANPSVAKLQELVQKEVADMENLNRKSQWIVLALTSGGCAAFNGVFAKLTTTELTTTFSKSIANTISLGSVEGGVEVVVRATFFALNLIFNGIMWTLFTKALARGTSTTQVSILNTSANFMFTAVMGWLIFSESLPPLWFLGAALLVAGNVIIGRRDEGERNDADVQGRERRSEEDAAEGEDLLGGEVELDVNYVEGESLEERKKRNDEEDDV
ncbi:uncharacterized protein RAG0_00313 [Rhynchosporium agropyri]|uniref:Transmembrane protein 42 n=3 Tax=Rhynchosporium TaxID=38037 RepID=A0A1E1LZD1_RHYSE|nr:uncharacterized protein RAG0_00313 [Rhynchosporium agropyri]CZS99918.1 uncharacterized protein RCO7_01677 [Rhynchosporium commune]CZT42221.1 uncharacterized protein RSE6_02076 [Rhynchosporium secalis]